MEDQSSKDDKSEARHVNFDNDESAVWNGIYQKKYWTLIRLDAKKQVGFIGKLIALANDKCKNQREELLDRHNPNEYRHILNLIFNSGYLTFNALVELANFVSSREISDRSFLSVYDEVNGFWKNPIIDLVFRDISGKRDRLRVMIGPEFQATMIAHYVKLFNYLRENKKGINIMEAYEVAIAIAKGEYSKVNKEFWSSFLFYVVGVSFLTTFAGAVVATLFSLSGFAALASCAVLLVNTLIITGVKFRSDYKIWPWDWVYWWKDARGNCLKVLKSEYMQDVLIYGNTDHLDKEILSTEGKRIEKEEENYEEYRTRITKLKFEKKNVKSDRKLYWSLFWLFAIVCIVAALTYLFPSVVAAAISLLLSVFKIELAFTIPAVVAPIALYVAIVTFVVAIIYSIMYSNKCDEYKQLKFDVYQQSFPPIEIENDKKYFAKLNGIHGYCTGEELRKNGIKLSNPKVTFAENEGEKDEGEDKNENNKNKEINDN